MGTISGIVLLVVYLIVYGISILISIAAYVLQGISLYGIAKRRGVKYPWLAWIPGGVVWIVGKIADDYRWKVKGKKTKFAMILLILCLVTCAMAFMVGIFYGVAVALMAAEVEFGFVFLIAELVFAVLMLPVVIASLVFQYIAIYDIFRSCDDKNAVLFLILSIVISVALPVLLFIVRNKDLGMVTEAEPVAEPIAEAVEEPEMDV